MVGHGGKIGGGRVKNKNELKVVNEEGKRQDDSEGETRPKQRRPLSWTSEKKGSESGCGWGGEGPRRGWGNCDEQSGSAGQWGGGWGVFYRWDCEVRGLRDFSREVGSCGVLVLE